MENPSDVQLCAPGDHKISGMSIIIFEIPGSFVSGGYNVLGHLGRSMSPQASGIVAHFLSIGTTVQCLNGRGNGWGWPLALLAVRSLRLKPSDGSAYAGGVLPMPSARLKRR
jgi:hypothetical protein